VRHEALLQVLDVVPPGKEYQHGTGAPAAAATATAAAAPPRRGAAHGPGGQRRAIVEVRAVDVLEQRLDKVDVLSWNCKASTR